MTNPSIIFNAPIRVKVATCILTYTYVAVQLDDSVDFYKDGEFLLRTTSQAAPDFIAGLKATDVRNS